MAPIIFIIIFLLFFCIVLNGVADLRHTKRSADSLETVTLPAVTVIVPVGNVQPATETALASLVQQDYPCCEFVFVTEKADEPAATAIRLVLKKKHPAPPPCRHIISGPAVTCSQKNHNLLAGISAAAPQTEIFVFCDSTHVARSDWLRQLTAPIAAGSTDIAGGYHRIVPQDTAIVSLGRSITVLILYLGQLIPGIAQPWGGNIAIRRHALDVMGIRNLWAGTVVDDVTLARQLATRGNSVTIVLSAEIETPLAGDCLKGLTCWITRQWLYLKFIFPLTWAAVGWAAYLLAAGLLWSIAGIVLLSVGLKSFFGVLPQIICLGLFSSSCMTLRKMHVGTCSVQRWFIACCATVFIVSWCHVRSIVTRWIHWAGRSYFVYRGGQVREIRKW